MTPPELLDEVHALIAARRQEGVVALAEQVSPAEWADVIPQLSDHELAALVHWLPDDDLAAVLSDLAPSAAADILRTLGRAQAADVLEAMPPDDATDVVAALPSGEAEQLLVAMEPEEAAEIRELMIYPPDSAGGVMTPGFVAIAPNLRVDEAIIALRSVAREVRGIAYVYVIDADERLLGVLSLHELVLAPPDAPIRDIMISDPTVVHPDDPAIDAARLLRDRNLLSLPVVSADGRLLGMITADDAIDIMEEEWEEDYLRLAGTDAEEMDRRSPLQVARLRLPWLLGTIGLELIAGLVIAGHDDVLREVILLASFMPVISAVSGNVGLQAAAIVVRGLDTGHVSLNRWRRQLAKELQTATIIALSCGLLLGVIGAVWSRHVPFGIVVGVALMASMLTAAFMGTIIPMLSKRFGFDPATTAGPFETAFQDIIGFGVFLWLASLMVDWLK